MAKFLLKCMGEIDEIFLEDDELARVTTSFKRRRVAKYSAVAALASVGIAAAVWLIRAKGGVGELWPAKVRAAKVRTAARIAKARPAKARPAKARPAKARTAKSVAA
ncbi:MAG: hypothetical protein FWF79_10205 [Defluviitaleaceae bacterium]|nr:hypothetical protein [Defluviitaleaceae bacterium]